MTEPFPGSRTLLPALLGAVLFATGGAAQPAPQTRIVGSWLGRISFGGASVRIVFHLSAAPGGNLGGTLDSPDQGATGIPLGSVRLEGDSLLLEIPAVAGRYAGRVAAGDSTVAGSWAQGGRTLPLDLARITAPPTVRRPQLPLPPFPYREETVSYRNDPADVTLGGTLTLPPGEGPFPAALLITGSGQQDRDETLFGHKPFLVLADYLTRRGIAVLRVDDRGVGASSAGNVPAATTADLADDVRAGLAFLKGRGDIDTRRISLVGHSEGGLIAPMVAAPPSGVAAIVLMAGPGLPGDRLLLQQATLISRAAGTPEETVRRERDVNREIYAIVSSESDTAAAADRVRRRLARMIAEMPPDERGAIGDSARFVSTQSAIVVSPWFRFFLSYDPRPALRRVACPVLAITGARDLQVPARENLREIEGALREGGNPDVTIREMPGLNHLFQTATTGAPSEYGTIEETFSPAALQAIGDWLVERLRR